MEAVQAAGYEPGEDIRIALDVAASELYDSKTEKVRGLRGRAVCMDLK